MTAGSAPVQAPEVPWQTQAICAARNELNEPHGDELNENELNGTRTVIDGSRRIGRIWFTLAPANYAAPTSSRQLEGFAWIRSSSLRAMGAGVRWPHSHDRTSAAGKPSMRAKTGWLTPTSLRVFRTSLALYFPGSGMVRTVRTVYFSRSRAIAAGGSKTGFYFFIFVSRRVSIASTAVVPAVGRQRGLLEVAGDALRVAEEENDTVIPLI
jgi:hypothetical protein